MVPSHHGKRSKRDAHKPYKSMPERAVKLDISACTPRGSQYIFQVSARSVNCIHLQISGYITDEDGKKKIALVGKWDSYLDMQKCDEEGEALPSSELVRLWTVRGLLHILQLSRFQVIQCISQQQCSKLCAWGRKGSYHMDPSGQPLAYPPGPSPAPEGLMGQATRCASYSADVCLRFMNS